MLVKKSLKFSAMFRGSDIVLPSTEIDIKGIALLLFLESIIPLIALHKVRVFTFLKRLFI